MDFHIAWGAARGFSGRYDLEFDNECGCVFEQPILENGVIQEKKKIESKEFSTFSDARWRLVKNL